MSTLTLVRHGQAAHFQGVDSRLTATGEAQAAKLAEYWQRHGVQFDEVFCGTLPRQIRTAEVAAQELGNAFPKFQCDASWNEYDAPGVLGNVFPNNPSLAPLAAEFERARGGPDENRRFQHMFEAAMTIWLEGTSTANGFEPWTAFRDRVTGAIRRIMEGPASRRVVVFTSGGPIGLAVQQALRAPPKAFLDVNWRVRNCSLTEFVFDRRRFTLDHFNSIPHLEDAALRTYR